VAELKHLIFILFLSLAAATNFNINACGSTTVAAGDTVNITGNIAATTASTITNGACIYINSVRGSNTGITINMKGFAINNVNSSATYGILINDNFTTTGSSGPIINGNGVISNFNIGVGILPVITTSGNGLYTVPYSGTTITYINATTAFYLNDSGANGIYSFNIDGTSKYCNVSNIIIASTPSVAVAPTYSGITTNSTCFLSPSFTSSTDGFQLFNSGKIFIINGVMNSSFKNITTNLGTFSYSFIDGANYSETSAAAAWYLNNPTKYILNGIEQYSISAVRGLWKPYTEFYCVGSSGICNPLLLQNYSSFPFFIFIPDSVQQLFYGENYTTIKWWLIQGGVSYLTAEEINSRTHFFTLMTNGQYNLELDGVNISILNTCPSSNTLCTLSINSSFNFTIQPVANANNIWTDINYSTYNTTANGSGNWINQNANFTFKINSSFNDLINYTLSVIKYFNYTTSVITYQIGTNSSGGTLNFSTNGTGRYDICETFTVVGFRTYQIPCNSIWLGNATGLSAIGQQLPTFVNGWTYGLFCLLMATAAIVGVSQWYSGTGVGIVGVIVFDFFAILWWDAPLVGMIDLYHLVIITNVAVGVWITRYG
jgi:hypothetical protein